MWASNERFIILSKIGNDGKRDCQSCSKKQQKKKKKKKKRLFLFPLTHPNYPSWKYKSVEVKNGENEGKDRTNLRDD
jgi:hypothetical protein